MIAIQAVTPSDAYLKGCQAIRTRHIGEVTDERGLTTIEIRNLVVEIEEPLEDRIPIGYNFGSIGALEAYSEQLRSGSNATGFEYTYGQRLREHFNVDQIQYIIDKLNGFRSTRRATAVLYDPRIDSGERKNDVPCMMAQDWQIGSKEESTLLVDAKIKNYFLHLTAFFRSHDFAGAYPANVYGLADLMKLVAEETDAEVGTLCTHSVSAHIYLDL